MANFFYDLAGADPIVKDLIYNESASADGDSLTYRGQFCKVLDYSDVGEGRHVCSIGEGTSTINILGIVMEEVAASGATYLLSSTSLTENWTRKKILVNPNAVYLVEYPRLEAAGNACTDDGLIIPETTAQSTTTPNPAADTQNGGWLYFLDGLAANELHFILNTTASTETGIETLRTAMISAVADGDAFLVINPPFDYMYLLNDTHTDFESELTSGSRSDRFVGIDYWMIAPGWPMQKLTASIHDGLIINDARFFHEVAISHGYLSGVHTIA